MVEESNQNVFLIQIDASKFAEFEISEFEISQFEISRFDCTNEKHFMVG